MTHRRIVGMALWTAVLLAAGRSTAQETAPAPPDADEDVSWTVRITWAPADSPPVDDFILGPRGGFFGEGKAGLDELLPADFAGASIAADVVSLSPQGEPTRTLTARLAVLGTKPANEKQLIEGVTKRLLERILKAHETHLEGIRAELSGAERQRNEARQRLLTVYGKLAELSVGGEQTTRDAERAQETTAGLQTELGQLATDLKAKSERLAAVREEVAKLAAQAQAPLPDDAIVTELGKLIALRTVQVETLQRAAAENIVPAAELEAAELALAEAKVHVAQRLDLLRERSVDRKLLTELTAEQTRLSIDLRELAAREQAMRDRVAACRKAADDLFAAARQRHVERLEAEQIIKADQSVAEQQQVQATARIEEIRRRRDAIRLPAVVILSPQGG